MPLWAIPQRHSPQHSLLMTRRSILPRLLALMLAVSTAVPVLGSDELSTNRRTPLVNAVERCRGAVVNLRGRKTVSQNEATDNATVVALEEEARQVNGMGTGVVIDPRGYILTNYHVVQDVLQIQVTTADRETTTATLLAHDPESDLALLKIATREPLQTIPLGTSSDLMLAETVAAVGNAYGYDNTVTVGIISHLNRTVQVNEHQVYRNLIQTDAPINPGNSGGPLINLDGEVIGINVAMRVGAQGIAFAIPINDAVEIASRLLAQTTGDRLLLGLSVSTQYEKGQPRVIVLQAADSDSAASGLKPGDRITAVDGKPVSRSLDFYCALLDKRPGDSLQLAVTSGSPVSLAAARTVTLPLQAATDAATQIAWKPLGLELALASEAEMAGRHPNYNKGLKVVRVRPNSPAEDEGIQPGDVLVAMHGFKTESFENLAYILRQPDLLQKRSFVFYILRNKDPLFGQLRLAEAK